MSFLGARILEVLPQKATVDCICGNPECVKPEITVGDNELCLKVENHEGAFECPMPGVDVHQVHGPAARREDRHYCVLCGIHLLQEMCDDRQILKMEGDDLDLTLETLKLDLEKCRGWVQENAPDLVYQMFLECD